MKCNAWINLFVLRLHQIFYYRAVRYLPRYCCTGVHKFSHYHHLNSPFIYGTKYLVYSYEKNRLYLESWSFISPVRLEIWIVGVVKWYGGEVIKADGSGRRKGTKSSVTSHPFASSDSLVRNVHYVQYIWRSQRSEWDMYLLQGFFKDLVTLLKNGTLYVSSGRFVAALVKVIWNSSMPKSSCSRNY